MIFRMMNSLSRKFSTFVERITHDRSPTLPKKTDRHNIIAHLLRYALHYLSVAYCDGLALPEGLVTAMGLMLVRSSSGTDFRFDNIQITGTVAAAVLEPSTFALAVFGLLGLAWFGLRRKKIVFTKIGPLSNAKQFGHSFVIDTCLRVSLSTMSRIDEEARQKCIDSLTWVRLSCYTECIDLRDCLFSTK